MSELEQIVNAFKEEIGNVESWMSRGSAASFEEYKEACGRAKGIRDCIDTVKSVIEEQEREGFDEA